MSSAAAAEAAPPAKGKKKLLLIVGLVVVVLALAGVAALVLLKKGSAEEDAEAADGKPRAAAKRDPKAVPTFVPLDPFTVNLADRHADRYAQVGITLEVVDAATAEQIKTFMPAIRNNILMVLAHKTSEVLLERDGKLKLAGQVQRETSRALGFEVEEPQPEPETAAGDDAAGEKAPAKAKRKPKEPEPELPVLAVHFSNFIIQ
jgi:flagellar FliL protein